jgi:hypothetical protein
VIRRLVALVAIVCFGGCASTATIARTDGPDSEAGIERSDASALYVRARNGRIYRIPRESISAIDHPGNVEILVGGSLLALLAVGISTAYNNNRNNGELLAVGLVYAIPGLALITSGLVKYVPSVRAAHAYESADLAPAGSWIPAPPPTAAPALPAPVPPPASPAQPAPSSLPPPEEPDPEVIPDATSPP